MSSPPKQPESLEASEARAWRNLASAVGRAWRIHAQDRATLKELARELQTSSSDVKRGLICSALLQVANAWHDHGRLIDVDNPFDWFNESLNAARSRLYEERSRITLTRLRRGSTFASQKLVQRDQMAMWMGIESALSTPPSQLDILLHLEAEAENERELQALLDRLPWLRDVQLVLLKNPDLSVARACRQAGVPAGRLRVLRHRLRHRLKRGPDTT